MSKYLVFEKRPFIHVKIGTAGQKWNKQVKSKLVLAQTPALSVIFFKFYFIQYLD